VVGFDEMAKYLEETREAFAALDDSIKTLHEAAANYDSNIDELKSKTSRVSELTAKNASMVLAPPPCRLSHCFEGDASR